MVFYLLTCVFFLSALSAQADSVAEQEAAIKLLGPDALELSRDLRNSKRGTLACLCLVSDDVPVCGVDGKRYLNECAATCRRVAVACGGNCPCETPIFEVGVPPATQLWHDVGEDSLDLSGTPVGSSRRLLKGNAQ